MTIKMSDRELERGKELFNDPLIMQAVHRCQEDVMEFLDKIDNRYVRSLKDGGMTDTEARLRMLSIVISQALQGMHDLSPHTTKEKCMTFVTTMYDYIHMQVTDEEVFGDKRPSG